MNYILADNVCCCCSAIILSCPCCCSIDEYDKVIIMMLIIIRRQRRRSASVAVPLLDWSDWLVLYIFDLVLPWITFLSLSVQLLVSWLGELLSLVVISFHSLSPLSASKRFTSFFDPLGFAWRFFFHFFFWLHILSSRVFSWRIFDSKLINSPSPPHSG